MTRIAGNMDNNVINRSNSSGVDIPKKLLPAAGDAGAAKTAEGKTRQMAKGERQKVKNKKTGRLCMLSFLNPLAFSLSPLAIVFSP